MKKSPPVLQPDKDPELSARNAGLRYVSDRTPGIRRVGKGKNFRYLDPAGRTIRNEVQLKRIRSLVIPPAWTDVWISTDPQGHLQAIGRDTRGRKQYRYHPRWRKTRDHTKYERMTLFGQILPKIRVRVSQDINASSLSQAKVLATIVRLLEATSMRIGNEEYTRQNHSFGLTTLRDRHVEIRGAKINFFFRGKRGIRTGFLSRIRHWRRLCGDFEISLVMNCFNTSTVEGRFIP